MTLIIGKRCRDGVILSADRRELRGYEPTEQTKIRQIQIEIDKAKALVLLAGAGVGAFWDETAFSLEQCLMTEAEPKTKTFLEIVSGVSSISVNLSTRYQRGGMDERLGCVIAGFENLTSGEAKMYYFAGAGFSETKFICLGSGDAYALPVADVLLNTPEITLEQATKFLPLIFLLVERVNLSVGGGPDIFILKDGEPTVQLTRSHVEEIRDKALRILKRMPDDFSRVMESPNI